MSRLTRNVGSLLLAALLAAGLLSSAAFVDARLASGSSSCGAYEPYEPYEPYGSGGSSVAIQSVTVTEGNAGTTAATFEVSALVCGTSGAFDGVTVDFTTVDGSATSPSDYQAQSGTLTFPCCGEAVQQVTVDVVGDAVYEEDESFTVVLSNAVGADITSASATATIVNDDPRITVVSPNGGEVLKAPSSRTIAWTWDGPLSGTVRIELLRDGLLLRTLASAAPLGIDGTGQFTWSVDRATPNVRDYTIRITSNAAQVSDTSDASFSIDHRR